MSGGGGLGVGVWQIFISIPAQTPSPRQAPHRTSLWVWILCMYKYDCGYQLRGTAQEKGQRALACRNNKVCSATFSSP